jgi:imidazolonepropionase-like amidohydrolase/ABC-type multidrug transport system permease subunit
VKAYLAYIQITLKLTLRDRVAFYFSFAFPLAFFFIFAQTMHAEQGGVILQVVTMVLILGVLGNGLFGAGIRAVQDRETNILRRFKVAPISPAVILVASLVTGWISFLPSALLIMLFAHFLYGMPIPPQWFALAVMLTVAVFCFRAIGLIVASVVNSAQEGQIVVQLLYMPMLFLSGITFPTSIMPVWLQIVAQFLPASHLYTGMQSILVKQEGLGGNLIALGALAVTTVVATLLGVKLFRWEKEEKMRTSGKLWLLAVLAPFLMMGTYQAYTRESIGQSKILTREMRRGRTFLFRGARIIVGDGAVIENGSVLVKGGKIAEIYDGISPDAKTLKAEPIEAAGKTLMPGLIDAHVHLGAPGGVPDYSKGYNAEEAMRRELASYLYSGVTAVRSLGDATDTLLKVRQTTASGMYLGSALLIAGPLFTAEGGHGTEYARGLPEQVRAPLEVQMTRQPKNADEARKQVIELKQKGVDCIKIVLEAGVAGQLFPRMDVAIARAAAEQAHSLGLPVAVHTGDDRDVADAISIGADSIEHGSARGPISDANLKAMAEKGIALDATLAVYEAVVQLSRGKFELLERSLVQQVGPASLIENTKKYFQAHPARAMSTNLLETATENLKRAYAAKVRLVTGTDSGNMLLIHGPAVHRELQLYVAAGIPAAVALQAATWNGARLLKIDGRAGAIRKGMDADLLLLNGNPLEDIFATERSISMVMFKGERVDRGELFDQ